MNPEKAVGIPADRKTVHGDQRSQFGETSYLYRDSVPENQALFGRYGTEAVWKPPA